VRTGTSRLTRLCVIVAVAFGALGLSALSSSPSYAAENVSWATFGGSQWWSQGFGALPFAVGGDQNEVVVSIGDPSYSNGVATMTFAAPDGESLAVGEYTDAQGPGTRQTGDPGIEAAPNWWPCATPSGSFTVNEIAFDGTSGVVTRLDLTYRLQCGTATYPVLGELVVNEPASDLVSFPRSYQFRQAVPGTNDESTSIMYLNLSSEPRELLTASLQGDDVSQFAVHDECTTLTLAPGDICGVSVTFRPSVGRTTPATATLVETDDGSPGTHDTVLSGDVSPGHTRAHLVGALPGAAYPGEEFDLTPSHEVTVDASVSTRVVTVRMQEDTPFHGWDLRLSVADGQTIGVGDYPAAEEYPDPANPSVKIVADGYGCGSGGGSFHIYELTRDVGTGALTAFSAKWQTTCMSNTDWSYGSVVWHAADPLHAWDGPGSPTDTTPPGTPKIVQAKARQTGVWVQWNTPYAIDADKIVVRYRKGKTPPGPHEGHLMYTGPAHSGSEGETRFMDGAPPNVNAAFSLFVRDRTGNLSKPATFTLRGINAKLVVPDVAGYGVAFPATVKVTSITSGNVVAYAPVKFYARTTTADPWTFIDRVAADAYGVATLPLVATKPGMVKAVVMGRSHLWGTAKSRSFLLSPGATGSYTGDIVAGGREVVKGKILPNLHGKRLSLQRLSGGSWTTVDSVRLPSDSSFRFAFRIPAAGRYTYRLHMAKTARFEALDERFVIRVF
jgi:hypothetical protein